MRRIIRASGGNCRGMTLVEILLSITILGIMSVLILGVFANALKIVSSAGDLDKTGNRAAKVTENAIAGSGENVTNDPEHEKTVKITGAAYDEFVTDTEIEADDDAEVNILFNDGLASEKPIDVSGKKKTITSEGNNNKVPIEVFIPNAT